MHFVTCPKQGREMEAVVLHRVGFLAYPCPKQGQDFKPSAAPLYPNMGQVPPPPGTKTSCLFMVHTDPRRYFSRTNLIFKELFLHTIRQNEPYKIRLYRMFFKETCKMNTKLALISKRKENDKPLGGIRQEGLVSKVQYRSKRFQDLRA